MVSLILCNLTDEELALRAKILASEKYRNPRPEKQPDLRCPVAVEPAGESAPELPPKLPED